MQLVRKKWFISFESGALLSRSEDRITYFFDEALSFGDRETAQAYLAANENRVSCTGLHPSLTEAA